VRLPTEVHGQKKKCNDAKWLKTWDFSCNDFLDDYSQYASVVAATPKKSDVPLATIGGEPGGRPGIVVDENIPEVHIIDEIQTTLAFGKAEPGRDIFAGEPVKDIKSDQTIAVAPVEEKEISSVFSQPLTETLLVDFNKGEELASSAASFEPARGVSSVEEAVISIQTHPAVAVQIQPQGPLDELAAEANRAAQELYPEAEGKK